MRLLLFTKPAIRRSHALLLKGRRAAEMDRNHHRLALGTEATTHVCASAIIRCSDGSHGPLPRIQAPRRRTSSRSPGAGTRPITARRAATGSTRRASIRSRSLRADRVPERPAILLGATPQVFLMYALFQIVYGQLQHVSTDLRTIALDWILSTPGTHHFHITRPTCASATRTTARS